MTIKCVQCGYTMSTADEIVRFGSEVVVKGGRIVLDIIFPWRWFRSALGVVAQPMNAIGTACPKCGSETSWENA